MIASMLRDNINRLVAIYSYLTTNLAAARCAKIDNNDVATSSRAAASTALSNETWTNGRAALLDGIIQDTIIKSIQTGFTSGVASSGTGEDAKYKDVTITSVTTLKCRVDVQGSGNAGGALTCHLTSATNLRISCPTGDTSILARWTVVEYK